MDEHETMDTAVEEAWEDEGASRAEQSPQPDGGEPQAGPEAASTGDNAEGQAAPAPDLPGPDRPTFQGEGAQAQPLAGQPEGGQEALTRLREGGALQADALLQRARARQQEQRQRADLERFLRVYPDVQAAAIPLEVWRQVSQGESLVSAYALHENRQLRAQLAAERQDRSNRQRTPGGLGGNVSEELDEIDRMWREDD
jgi:hypothetical protein